MPRTEVACDIPVVKRWLVAVRPFAYSASVLAVALGAALSYHEGHPVKWGLLAVTLLGVVCFHSGANLMNDCYDHRRGLDTQVLPTSGAIVRGWLTESQVFRAAMLFFGVGAACGVVLAVHAGWVVVLLGAMGSVCALGYTTPRFCFKYAGWGDAVIFLTFGVLPVFGAYWVQAGEFSWLPVLWSLPLVSYTVAILHANNWRDIRRDSTSDCRTVAGMLGTRGSARYYAVLVLGPFALVAGGVVLGLAGVKGMGIPIASLAVFLSLPMAVRLARVRPDRDAGDFAMLDGKTAQLHTAFGVLIALAFCIARTA